MLRSNSKQYGKSTHLFSLLSTKPQNLSRRFHLKGVNAMHCELANNESIDRRKSATPCGQLLHVYVLDTRAAKYKSREIDWTRPVAAWMPERRGEGESLGHCGCHWQARLASSLLSASCLWWSSLHNASIDTVRDLPVCSARSKCTVPAISPRKSRSHRPAYLALTLTYP